MDHSFIPSPIDTSKCARCKFPSIAHTDQATCEFCNQIKSCEIYIDTLVCLDCIEKEKQAERELKETENDRVAECEKNALERIREVNQSINLRTDLFNAQTVSIIELKKVIDDDPSIQNKHFKLAEELQNQFNHFQALIFDLDDQKIQATNKQRAIQVYLNDLANKLRQEERDKLRLQDINYQPKVPIIKKPKAPSKRKLDKVELRKFAAEIGVSEFTLQTIVISKNISVEDAARLIKESINTAKGNQ